MNLPNQYPIIIKNNIKDNYYVLILYLCKKYTIKNDKERLVKRNRQTHKH
jgi:hypothetical protein